MGLKSSLKDKKAVQLHWLQRAASMAKQSPHPAVKVGAVLVDAAGNEISRAANRFAHGVDDKPSERYVDGSRSLWINCAEQMVIARAVRKQSCLKGARLYVTLSPCAVCAGLIAECGIAEVIVPKNSCRANGRLKAKWKKSITIGLAKMQEAGVKLTLVDLEE
ncbi:MAG TPA: hypothetical protein DCY07_05390 [Rhodospirillaceae bacterium]|nr:hypothetical protein [Rhodospirillaceae bacterium]